MDDTTLSNIDYGSHRRVQELLNAVRDCLEDISLSFDRWDEPYVKGPGMYVAVVCGTSVAPYADPMGDNRWPVEECRNVFDGENEFRVAAGEVARHADGAVVVGVDGTIQEQMVRFNYRPGDDNGDVTYADWMGSRHMSAADTSAREEVVAAVTLSEETGRVSAFHDGEFSDATRAELGGSWRVV